MKNHLHRSTGICLILGSIFIIITMVLHPVGGDVSHLLQVSKNLIGTHSLGIFSLPIAFFGFYGLTDRFSSENGIAMLAFIIIGFGLIAAMLAALMNGIVLPTFLEGNEHILEQRSDIIDVFISYNFTVNKAFDYVFIGACCLSIAVYSVLMIMSKNTSKWLGYFGLLIVIISAIGLVSGFAFASLLGFRLFTFSLAGWVLMAGMLLIKSK